MKDDTFYLQMAQEIIVYFFNLQLITNLTKIIFQVNPKRP